MVETRCCLVVIPGCGRPLEDLRRDAVHIPGVSDGLQPVGDLFFRSGASAVVPTHLLSSIVVN